jgi:hypothetical protein
MYHIQNFSYRDIQQYAHQAVTLLGATRPNDRKKVNLWPLAKQYLESSRHTPTHDDSAPHNAQTIVPTASDREVVTTSTINDVNATASTHFNAENEEITSERVISSINEENDANTAASTQNRKAKSFICHKQAELDRQMFGTDE